MARLALLVALVVASAAREAMADCARSTTWDAFVRCNHLRTRPFEIVHDLPEAKLVAMDNGYNPDARQLLLYVRVDGIWMRSFLNAETNLHTELLGFERLADGAYRIEVGYAAPQWVTFDQVSRRPALLRRRTVHVCRGLAACQTAMASCEVLVHGKAVAGYRGEAIWDGQRLRLRADMSAPSVYCPRPRNVRVEEPQ